MVTRAPARSRLRRRLLIYSAPLTVIALLVAVKAISVVVAGNSAASAFARGDANAVRADAAVLSVANVVEPAKASFAAGAAAVLDGRLDDADYHFSAALTRDAAGSCLLRVNLELVRETQGDRAAAAGDQPRAHEHYLGALAVVNAAPHDCFSGNNDSDPQRRAIRQDTANRLAAKLNAPPPAVPSPPPPPPPAAPPPPPPPVALVTPDGREIPPRRLDPTGGDPLDKLQQVLRDAAGAVPP